MNINNRSLLTLCGLLVTPALIVAQTTDAPSETPTADIVPSSTPDASEPADSSSVMEESAPSETPDESVPESAPVDAPVDASAMTELTPLASDAEPAVDEAAVVVVEDEKPKDTLSVDFPDEDVRNILRNVADLFELNIVIPDTLQGRTSIKLRDVTWRQIFKVVLTPLGYTTVEDGNIIKVVTVESLAQEPLVTEVFVLNYARAEEIEKSILPLVDSAGGGRVLVDKRINALIISERPSKMVRITPVLTSLDKATEQVMIESKFIEVNDTDVKNLGVNWASLNNYQVGYSPIDLLMSGNRDGIGTNTGGVTPGVDPTQAGIAYGAVLTAPQFNVALRFLQSENKSKVVSNPTIVTLNNTPAEINVGEEYPIPNYTYNAEQGRFEVSGFEYKPIGVLLKVTPQVNAQGFIRLNLEPEISVRAPDPVSFGGASAVDIPIIRTRKTKTQVSMKDGHTLAIGGLLDTSEGVNNTKVPVLGNIPGIGRLFRSKSDETTKRNLLIFITSKIVSSDSAPVRDVFSAEQIHSAGLRRSELPGIRRTDDEGLFVPEAMPESVPPAAK